MACFRPKQTDFMFANTFKERERETITRPQWPGANLTLSIFLFISLSCSAATLVLIESAVKYRWTQEASRLFLPFPPLHPPSRLSSLFILLSLYLPLLLRSDCSLFSLSRWLSLSLSPPLALSLPLFIMSLGRLGIKSEGARRSQSCSNKQTK